mmetsp:Transcript_54424/g.158136  ORF Transcript_54424/g.158136 Transcript_54424/m.158136 type:complete len:397 (-) Transcript_54424:294-1484(-)
MVPWGVATTAVLLSLWTYRLLERMPVPYDDRVAEAIPAERIALLPGNDKGPKVPADLTGVFAENARLKSGRNLFVGVIEGAESVAVTPSGELQMLDKFGYLHRARPTDGDGLSFELLKDTAPLYIGPGRPLGYHSVEDGKALLVCDSLKGLLRVDLELGTIQVLANRITATGQPLNYVNDLDVADDGMVYFTSSTAGIVSRNKDGFYDTMRSYMYNLFASDASGQLLSYNPKTREVVSLIQNIYFANGVAVSADGSFVAVVETNLARVRRYWLSGPKKGTHEVMVDKLPGYPDGISRSRDGGFWVALIIQLSPMPKMLAAFPKVRQFISHFAMDILPYVAKPWGCVVKLDSSGKAVDILMDRNGEVVRSVSAAIETADGRLFLGNLGGSGVSVVKL